MSEADGFNFPALTAKLLLMANDYEDATELLETYGELSLKTEVTVSANEVKTFYLK
jgi:hypothetical protein